MLRALVTLQADILDIQAPHRVKEKLRREEPMLLMLKLGVALPAQADPQFGILRARARQIGRPVDVLVLPPHRQAGRHAGQPEVMHDAEGSLVLDDHVHALGLTCHQGQRPGAGHDDLIAALLQLAGKAQAVDLVAQARLKVQERGADLLPIPERRRHVRLLVAENLLDPATLKEHHAVVQVALAHLVPAAIESRAMVLRLLDRQLLSDLLAALEVAYDPGGQLHVKRVDHLGRQRLLAPEAGLHEVLAHVLQDVGGVTIVTLGQLWGLRVQPRHLPDFLVALLRGVLVEVVEVIVEVADLKKLVDAGELFLGVGDQVFVLDKEKAGLVVVEAREKHLIGLLEVVDQVTVAKEILDVIGLRHAHEGCRAVVDVANGGDDFRLSAQKFVQHAKAGDLGPVPRLVDHDRLFDLGVFGVHDAAQHGLDLVFVRCRLLRRAALPRLEGVEHHLAHAAGGAGVEVRMLVQERGEDGAARAGKACEEVEGFLGH